MLLAHTLPHPPSVAHALADALGLLRSKAHGIVGNENQYQFVALDSIGLNWSAGGVGMAMCFWRRDLEGLAAAIMGEMAENIHRPRIRRGSSNGHGGESKAKNGFSAIENNNLVSEAGAIKADGAGAVT